MSGSKGLMLFDVAPTTPDSEAGKMHKEAIGKNEHLCTVIHHPTFATLPSTSTWSSVAVMETFFLPNSPDGQALVSESKKRSLNKYFIKT